MASLLTAETRRALADRLDPARLAFDEPLAPYTTFRIGGPADARYDAASADDLVKAVTAARELQLPWFILGLGANVLIGDRGVRGLVIRNCARAWTLDDATGRLTAESGAVLGAMIIPVVNRGWSGIEHYIGIPTTLGGAVWQNLHFLSPAPARERTMFIAEVFDTAELLGEDGRRWTVDRAGMRFGYDDSLLHHTRDVCLTVTLALAPGDVGAMHRVLQENLSWRGARHPWLEYHPSVGSIFKKIDGIGAGRLIDQCGLKGFRIGDAQISHLHANIIVNVGAATAADVRAVIAHAQAAVAERFGQRLEPEIGFVGE